MSFTPTELLSYLPSRISEDSRQDIYLSLLEAQPSTEAEIEAIIRKAVNAARYQERSSAKRYSGADVEFTCHVNDTCKHPLFAALALLTPTDREIINNRFIRVLPVRQCAALAGCSQPTYRERLEQALQRARDLCLAHGLIFV
jgi:DNA-directed RNA polymerase specialized sigma24 family protein